MENTLKKYLSKAEVFALSFGCAIGWGVFMMPGSNFLPSGGPLGTIIGVLIGALVMIIIGRNYHILMQKTNDNGGAYSYAKNVFGIDHGFLVGWFIILIYIAILWANSSAFVLLMRYTVGNVFQFGFHYTIAGYDIWFGEMLLSTTITVGICLLCAFKKKIASITQVVFASILIIGILITCIWVFVGNSRGAAAFTPAFSDQGPSVLQIFSIVALMPWAFVGFESISHSQTEIKFPVKKTLILMFLAIIFGALCYILLVGISVVGTPDGYETWLDYIKDLPNLSGIDAVPTFNAVNLKMGKAGIVILGLTMSGALVTSIIANTTAASRILCSLSEDSILPKWFGKINKYGSPGNAILFIIGTVVIIPFLGRTSIGWVADITSICSSIAFLYTSLAAIKVSKESKLKNGIVTGVIGVAMSLVFFASYIVPNFIEGATLSTESYFIFAIWGIVGLIFFRIIINTKAKNTTYGSSIVVWVVLLSMILTTSLLWLYQNINGEALRVEKDIDAKIAEVIADASMSEDVRIAAINNFISEQTEHTKYVIMYSVLVVGVMMILSVALMFNIYSIAKKREKAAQIESVQAQEKSKAKSAFLFNMSHDIRTPMNAIVGFTELARAENVSKEQMKDYLDKIDSSSHQLLALINDILEMSRIENGKYVVEEDKVNILSVLDDMKTIFSVQMSEKQIDFRVEHDVKSPHIITDKKGINRILLNLIGNAYKFTPIGGKITVSLTQGEVRDDGKLKHTFVVADTGVGMSEEFLKDLFLPFERENNSTISKIEGTGLGMSITKSIVEAMGGEIKVTSKKNEGSTFTITLYCDTSNEVEQAAEEIEFEETIDISGKRVLVVDDVEINREIASLMTEKLGLIPTACANGKEALDLLIEKDFDLVLCDVQMPIMDGYTFTGEVRKLDDPIKKNIPIIALTANAFEEDVKNALAHGMNGHIAKPISADILEKTIKKVLIESHKKVTK